MRRPRLYASCIALSALALLATSTAAAIPAGAATVASHSGLSSLRPMSPPAGGAVITTYYSDANHTQVVGQYLSSPCQGDDWGVRTSYYSVGFVSGC